MVTTAPGDPCDDRADCSVFSFDRLRADAAGAGGAPDPATAAMEATFRDTVHPFLRTYCLECHDKQGHKGDLDLSAYPTLESVARNHKRWEAVLEQLEAKSMPPAKAKRQPEAKRAGMSPGSSVFPSLLRRDGTGLNRPPIKKLHRSANDPHGHGASSSKDSPCRSNEAAGAIPRLACQGDSDESS